MKQLQVAAAAVLLLLAGCISFERPDERESEVQIKMKMADSLSATSSIHDAALAYQTIATEYPSSPQYADAVMRTACLSVHPRNESPDDTTALRWLDRYVMLPVGLQEKQRGEMELSLLTKLEAARDSIAARRGELDSLRLLARSQSMELQNRDTKIHDLEAQVKATNDELAKLREVDIKISRRAAKK